MMMNCPGWMGGGWGGMGVAMVVWSVVLVALIVAVLWLIGRMLGDRTPRSSADDRSSALTILEERFARGEIDREEFAERRRTLDE